MTFCPVYSLTLFSELEGQISLTIHRFRVPKNEILPVYLLTLFSELEGQISLTIHRFRVPKNDIWPVV
jgi:hypothetical protein